MNCSSRGVGEGGGEWSGSVQRPADNGFQNGSGWLNGDAHTAPQLLIELQLPMAARCEPSVDALAMDLIQHFSSKKREKGVLQWKKFEECKLQRDS
jgi:hypothetical protein